MRFRAMRTARPSRRSRCADPARTRILFNRQVSYKNRKLPTPEHSRLERVFMGEHAMVEYNRDIWNEVIRLINAALQ